MMLIINYQMNCPQLGGLKIKVIAVHMSGRKSVLQQCSCSNHCVGKQLSVMVLTEEDLTTVFQCAYYYGQVGK